MSAHIEAELRRHFEVWADVDVPPVPDLAFVEQEGRDLAARRRGWVLAAVAAAVVIVVVLTSATLALRTGGDRVEPAPPVDTTPADPDRAIDPAGARNGRIVSQDAAYDGPRAECDAASYCPYLAEYDPGSGTALFVQTTDPYGPENLAAVVLAGPKGRLSTLTCPEDYACVDGFEFHGVTLGPGADEITMEAADQTVQVLGSDGTLRDTIDLSGALGPQQNVDSLAWSPDRSRLAVVTGLGTGYPNAGRLWLLDRDGGSAGLVYAPTYDPGFVDLASVGWSPDGSRIGLVERHTRFEGCGCTTWQGVVALQLPEPDQSERASAETLYEYDDPMWEEDVAAKAPPVSGIAWSPDGMRLAATFEDGVLEISAADGSVLDRHPPLRGPEGPPLRIWFDRPLWLAKE